MHGLPRAKVVRTSGVLRCLCDVYKLLYLLHPLTRVRKLALRGSVESPAGSEERSGLIVNACARAASSAGPAAYFWQADRRDPPRHRFAAPPSGGGGFRGGSPATETTDTPDPRNCRLSEEARSSEAKRHCG